MSHFARHNWQSEELRKARNDRRSIHWRRRAGSIRAQVRRALLMRHKTPDRYKAAIGCTYLELARHIESKFAPGMTWENMGEWHVDHIIPVAHFIKHDPDGCNWNHFTNLQPLWARDNLSKGART